MSALRKYLANGNVCLESLGSVAVLVGNPCVLSVASDLFARPGPEVSLRTLSAAYIFPVGDSRSRVCSIFFLYLGAR